jgi:hypothetical protein
MPHASQDLDRFRSVLGGEGLYAALGYLNGRTPFRFTGVYRFDGETLRNVKLYDRWEPTGETGADAPMQETFCAIVRQQGDGLQVSDGRSDERFPWMQANAVVCYCGALIRDGDGDPFGTVCHFDLQRCEPPKSELDLLRGAAPHVYVHLQAES